MCEHTDTYSVQRISYSSIVQKLTASESDKSSFFSSLYVRLDRLATWPHSQDRTEKKLQKNKPPPKKSTIRICRFRDYMGQHRANNNRDGGPSLRQYCVYESEIMFKYTARSKLKIINDEN